MSVAPPSQRSTWWLAAFGGGSQPAAAAPVAGGEGPPLGGGVGPRRTAVVDDPALDGEQALEQPAGGDAGEEAVADRVAVEGAGHAAVAVERLEEQAPLDGAEAGRRRGTLSRWAAVRTPAPRSQRGSRRWVGDERQPFGAAALGGFWW